MVLKEPSFFCLVKIVEIKPLFSRSHSMMTPLSKSFLISLFMIFISCSLCGILGADVIPGLPLKLIFRPFYIISRITLSLVIFCHTLKLYFKFPAIKFLIFLSPQLTKFSSCSSCSCSVCFPFSL